jgi:hypothetical protein
MPPSELLAQVAALRRSAHGPLASLWLSLLVLLPVSIAVGDHGWAFSVVTFLATGLLLGTLCVVLPFGPVFALGAVTATAAYTCVFTVVSRSAFPSVHPWPEAVAFALPLVGFAALVALRRRSLSALRDDSADETNTMAHLARFARWLALNACIATLALALPLNRLSPEWQGVALVGAMALITALSMASLRQVLLLLADVAAILGFVGARMRFLAAPMITYTMMFALMTVAFGCGYRIADGLSRPPLFLRFGEPAKIDFAEAMHFSVVTLATVGYGDIIPADNGVRLLATVQMLLGQLLLLFGFAEVVRERVAKAG